MSQDTGTPYGALLFSSVEIQFKTVVSNLSRQSAVCENNAIDGRKLQTKRGVHARPASRQMAKRKIRHTAQM